MCCAVVGSGLAFVFFPHFFLGVLLFCAGWGGFFSLGFVGVCGLLFLFLFFFFFHLSVLWGGVLGGFIVFGDS